MYEYDYEDGCYDDSFMTEDEKMGPEWIAALEAYQDAERREAHERERLGEVQARRPYAVPKKIAFRDLEIGDFMTADGLHYVEVTDRKPSKKSDRLLEITFKTPQPIGVGMHDSWVIDKDYHAEVVIDESVRNEN